MGYVPKVHPIEHLRYVARAHGVDPVALVEETAHALGSLHFDPAGLVVACRRIVERHPFAGPLWWLCSRIVTAAEPFDAVWEVASEMRSDPTAKELAAALPDDADLVTIGDPLSLVPGLARRGDVRVLALDVDHSATSFVRRLERHDVDYEPVDAGLAGAAARTADVVLVEPMAADAERLLVPSGTSTIAAAGAAARTPVWAVLGVGRRLPSVYVDTMIERRAEMLDELDEWTAEVEVIPTSLVTHVLGPHGLMPAGPPAFQPECSVAGELLRTSPM